MILPCLYIAPAGSKDRGVFTSEAIQPGTKVEVAPVIVLSADEREKLDQTLLHDYIFEWGDDRTRCCMALGYVPLYNHANQSNCEYEMDYDNRLISITAVRYIESGEELCINYNGDWDNSKPVWFAAQ